MLAIGLSVGALGIWWMQRARPRAGAYVDVLAVATDAAVAIRGEDGGKRSFVELIADGRLQWQALVPRYADPPRGTGLAASGNAVTVRVVRDGRPELFALATRDAEKLGGLHLSDRPPAAGGYTLPRVATVSDGARSFELFGDDRAVDAVAIGLGDGHVLWRVGLGPGPIEDAAVVDGDLVVRQAGRVRGFNGATGDERLTAPALPAPLVDAIEPRVFAAVGAERASAVVVGDRGRFYVLDPVSHRLASVDGAAQTVTAIVRWPDGARVPAAQHVAPGALWLVAPGGISALDAVTLAPLHVVGAPPRPTKLETSP